MKRKCTCTKCGHENVVVGKSWELNHSDPIISCQKCGADVLKKRCRELAISKPCFNDKLPIQGEIFLVLLIGLVQLYSCFPGGGVVNIQPNALLAGTFFVVVAILASIGSLKTYKRRLQYIKDERVRSAKRCEDPAHIEKLMALDYPYKRK